MKRTTIFLMAAVTLAIAVDSGATTVDVSLATDKTTYLLGEPVTVFVTAYNPHPGPVVLIFGSTCQASYLMDGVFDWTEGKGFADVMTQVTIQPQFSITWDLTHGSHESARYPLSIGTHSVVGEVINYGQSAPVEFDIIPEPATLILLGLGAVMVRRK